MVNVMQRRRDEEPTKDLEAQSASVCGPLNISGGLHTHHLFAYWWDPWKYRHQRRIFCHAQFRLTEEEPIRVLVFSNWVTSLYPLILQPHLQTDCS